MRGGDSLEYQTSLGAGAAILKNLPEGKYRAVDVLWAKDGFFHENGFPKPLNKILAGVDVVINALSGGAGENGKIQQMFEAARVPYTGSGAVPSALASRKFLSREVFGKAGLKIPAWTLVSHPRETEAKAHEMFLRTSPYWVIKPASLGSGIGVGIAKSRSGIGEALSRAFFFDQKALIEEHISGREFSAGILEHFRKQKYYTFPVVEKIRRHEFCPAKIDLATSRKIQEVARRAHEALGLSHYSSSDVIVSKRGIFLLETDALPPLLPEGAFVRAAEAIGLEFPQLLDHVVTLARERKF